MTCTTCGKECPLVKWDPDGECPACVGSGWHCHVCRDRGCEGKIKEAAV